MTGLAVEELWVSRLSNDNVSAEAAGSNGIKLGREVWHQVREAIAPRLYWQDGSMRLSNEAVERSR